MLQSCFQNAKRTFVKLYSIWNQNGFKFAFAAIDGSHSPIKCPPGGPEAMKQYHNFKNFYSVVLLVLVDAKYRFMWAALGAPGNTHDSTYFQSTHLFHEINEGNVLPEKFQFIGNTKIPPMILGDGAFPMKPWMCKPFGDAVLTEERLFQLSLKPCVYGIRRCIWKTQKSI